MSTTFQHLQTLVGLGARPIASPANQAAADYIRDHFCVAGLDVEEQPYAATAWEHHCTFLEWDGKNLDCAANAFSLPCDVTAPLSLSLLSRSWKRLPQKGRFSCSTAT